jgi:hypothetical protein
MDRLLKLYPLRAIVAWITVTVGACAVAFFWNRHLSVTFSHIAGTLAIVTAAFYAYTIKKRVRPELRWTIVGYWLAVALMMWGRKY